MLRIRGHCDHQEARTRQPSALEEEEAQGRAEGRGRTKDGKWIAPFDPGAKQALLESGVLTERAALLIQLMQFLRMAQGGGDLSPRLQ